MLFHRQPSWPDGFNTRQLSFKANLELCVVFPYGVSHSDHILCHVLARNNSELVYKAVTCLFWFYSWPLSASSLRLVLIRRRH